MTPLRPSSKVRITRHLISAGSNGASSCAKSFSRSASVNFVAAIPHLLWLGTCVSSHRKTESAPNQVKDCLAKIDADCMQFHGTPPPYVPYTQTARWVKAADYTFTPLLTVQRSGKQGGHEGPCWPVRVSFSGPVKSAIGAILNFD